MPAPSPTGRRLGAIALALGVVLMLIGFATAPQAGAGEPIILDPGFDGFKGLCINDLVGGGTCVIDEPEGKNPALHGTVVYTRATDVLTFNVFPSNGAMVAEIDGEGTGGDVQICVTPIAESATNPYVPTNANTCAGHDRTGGHRMNVTETTTDPPPWIFTIDLTDLISFAAGDTVWFAMHINIIDPILNGEVGTDSVEAAGSLNAIIAQYTSRTTYVVGASVLQTPPTSTTTAPSTTTTTAAPTTTTAAPTTTAQVAASTTTDASVLGVVVTRPQVAASTQGELPRTGLGQELLMLGAALVFLGLSLIVVSHVPTARRI